MRAAAVMLSVVWFGSGCAAEQSTADDEAAVRAVTVAMTEAMEAGDHAAISALFADDAVMVPPGEAPVVGRAAIDAWGERMLSGVQVVEGDITVEDVHVAGDFAAGYGTWTMTMAMAGDTLTETTRWMLWWERQEDGRWLITRDIWNSGA